MLYYGGIDSKVIGVFSVGMLYYGGIGSNLTGDGGDGFVRKQRRRKRGEVLRIKDKTN